MKYLFRGFHKCENGTKTITVNGVQHKDEWIYWDEFGRLTETLNLGTIVFYKDCEISKVPIIPETVGQWTGLTDKNGVNVFSGDNLRFSNKYEWYKHSFDFSFMERKEINKALKK